MNITHEISNYLGIKPNQLENLMLEDWLRWCQDKSYCKEDYTVTPDGKMIFHSLHGNDLQNLLADSSLFKFWGNIWADCVLQFLEDCDAMNPKPSPKEAYALYKIQIQHTYTLYSKKLLNQARTKKIDLPCPQMN